MSFTGNELRERNEKIVNCMVELKTQRHELNFLIEKQQEEKIKLQTEIERITYKLSLINKSLSQRITTRANYDRTIKQAENSYNTLLESSGILLESVEKEVIELEQGMNKKIGTENGGIVEHVSNNTMDSSQYQSEDGQSVEQHVYY